MLRALVILLCVLLLFCSGVVVPVVRVEGKAFNSASLHNVAAILWPKRREGLPGWPATAQTPSFEMVQNVLGFCSFVLLFDVSDLFQPQINVNAKSLSLLFNRPQFKLAATEKRAADAIWQPVLRTDSS